MFSSVIVIPYRDRKKHFEYFIDNTVPLIQKHLPHTKIIVVEQANDKLFNRGKLLNVGFMEYKDKTTYFFTHDVDINPTEDVIKTIYSNNNVDVYRIKSAHDKSLGGVIKVKHDIMFDINGFPNDIWGWGIEDRALYYRCCMKKYKITDNKNQSFKVMPHAKNSNPDGMYKNEKKIISDTWSQKNIDTLNKKQKEELITGSGLNNIDYSIIKRKYIHSFVELIEVDI